MSMARRPKLTNNSDEAEIARVLSGDSIFGIPYFQRPYKWKPERIRRLQEDILNVVDSLIDETPDSHFLGAIIIHGRRRNPSEPTVFEVIDGQQRLTTIFIFIAAIVRTLCKLQQYDDALGLFQRYLALGRQTGMLSNVKLHPGKEDRKQFNWMMSDLIEDPILKDRLGSYLPLQLPDTGPEKGPLKNNYRAALRFLESQNEQGGLERIRLIITAILDFMSVVQIDVFDPTNGPKIFDSLNSRQEPMTIGDLIRNEVFSRVANHSPEEIERLDRDRWQPFYEKFRQGDKNLFDSYFFPYGLIKDPNLAKSEVYGHLRESWKDIDAPDDIISELARYQDAFIDIVVGTNHQRQKAPLRDAIFRLHAMDAPSATYPFLIQVSQAAREETLDEKTATALLEVTESFLVRRAIAGIEPTGLHAVFKRLWNDLGGNYSTQKLVEEIRKHSTVKWPTDGEFSEEVKMRSLYGSSITPFFISQYDRSLGGDVPHNIPWIEHVLPQEPEEGWWEAFTREQHEQMKDRLSNLIPLSSQMNQSLKNGRYEKKRKRYSEDSMFKSARLLAKHYSEWTPTELTSRADELGNWAIGRWRY
jgi:hypothetical protein